MSDLETYLSQAYSSETFDRVQAAEHLGSYSPETHEGVAQALRQLLEDEASEVRQLAFYSLATWQKEDLSIYEQATRDQAYLVRTAAAEMLGQIQNSEAASELLITLLKDPYYSVRATAAEALGQQEAFLAIPALQDALLDSDQWVRYSAAESLNQIEPDSDVWEHIMLLHSTLDPEDRAYQQALEALKTRSDRRIILTLLFLFKQTSTPQPAILNVLTTFHDYLVIPALIDIALFTDNPQMRETALIAAQSLSIPETLKALKSWLDPDYLSYAQRAVELLAQLPMPKEVRPLLQAALSLPDQWIRTVALNALEKQGATVDSQILAVLIKDPSPDLATTALINLAHHYPDQLQRYAKSFAQSQTPWKEEALALALRYAPDALVDSYAADLMASPHANTRESLCKSLKYHGSAQALLLEALEDSEDWVRQEAVKALGSFQRPEVSKALARHVRDDEDFMVRAVAAQALEKHEGIAEVDSTLRQALKDSSASVRLQALRSLLYQHPLDLASLEDWFHLSDKAIQLALIYHLSKYPDLPLSTSLIQHLHKTSQSPDLQLASAAQRLLEEAHTATNTTAQ